VRRMYTVCAAGSALSVMEVKYIRSVRKAQYESHVIYELHFVGHCIVLSCHSQVGKLQAEGATHTVHVRID